MLMQPHVSKKLEHELEYPTFLPISSIFNSATMCQVKTRQVSL